MTRKLYSIVGGQFGSEAKGHVAAQLAKRELEEGQDVWAVRVAGHNAGHTAYSWQGDPFALRTIPCMAVVSPDVQCFIAAGSELSIDVLTSEIEMLEAAGIEIRHRLFIDVEATLIEDHHIAAETDATMHERLGSTGKGVGAARSERLLRKARRWGDLTREERPPNIIVASLANSFQYEKLNDNVTIIVEGTQGFGLGLHAGFYPYCTSSDCRSIDFLAMAGIDPLLFSHLGHYEAIVVCRTYPIRVAGNSGALLDETSWEELGELTNGHIKPERTTVTKKVRRVGGWDQRLVERAIQANGGPDFATIALSFADYLDPSIYESEDWDEVTESEAVALFLDQLTEVAHVTCITTGPNTIVWAGHDSRD